MVNNVDERRKNKGRVQNTPRFWLSSSRRYFGWTHRHGRGIQLELSLNSTVRLARENQQRVAEFTNAAAYLI